MIVPSFITPMASIMPFQQVACVCCRLAYPRILSSESMNLNPKPFFYRFHQFFYLLFHAGLKLSALAGPPLQVSIYIMMDCCPINTGNPIIFAAGSIVGRVFKSWILHWCERGLNSMYFFFHGPFETTSEQIKTYLKWRKTIFPFGKRSKLWCFFRL